MPISQAVPHHISDVIFSKMQDVWTYRQKGKRLMRALRKSEEPRICVEGEVKKAEKEVQPTEESGKSLRMVRGLNYPREACRKKTMEEGLQRPTGAR